MKAAFLHWRSESSRTLYFLRAFHNGSWFTFKHKPYCCLILGVLHIGLRRFLRTLRDGFDPILNNCFLFPEIHFRAMLKWSSANNVSFIIIIYILLVSSQQVVWHLEIFNVRFEWEGYIGNIIRVDLSWFRLHLLFFRWFHGVFIFQNKRVIIRTWWVAPFLTNLLFFILANPRLIHYLSNRYSFIRVLIKHPLYEFLAGCC